MKCKYLPWIILQAGILSSSCSTYISFPVSTPPQIKTEGGHKTIAFINRYDYTSLPFDNENKKDVYTSGVLTLIRNLESSFRVDENFSFVILDSLVKGPALPASSRVMGADSVTMLCEGSGADMLLVLESFNPFFSTETEVIRNEDGSKTRTNYVDLIVRAGFVLYDNKGDILDEVVATESMYYQTRPALSSLVVIGPAMGRAGEEVSSLAGMIGASYIHLFYPGSKMVSNLFYTGTEFREATQRARYQDWTGAIQLLQPLSTSADPKLARKAAHNLAVAYQALGDQDAYNYWLERSKK